jgi:Xaa-Pro aminopeptidase
MSTKRQTAIDIMNSNRDKSFDQVVEMIMSSCNLPVASARSYYRYMIKENLVEGYSLTDAKPASKAQKTVKLSTIVKKTSKAFVEQKAAKTAEEVAAIKEKNLETMRKVTEKLNKGKKKVVRREYDDHRKAAPEGEGVSDFDPQLAREEIDAVLRDEKLIGQVPKFAQGDY